MQKLIDYVYPSGDLLLVRAREPGGNSIATGIYAGFGRLSFFWGNASWREHQFLRPNEALHWFALRYWKDRGMWHHEWGGEGAFKARFRGTPFAIPAFRKSRYKFIQYARDTAVRAYYLPRELRKRYEAKIRKKEFEVWIWLSLDAVDAPVEWISLNAVELTVTDPAGNGFKTWISAEQAIEAAIPPRGCRRASTQPCHMAGLVH